jgi:dolichyl-phosphate beta-glucosyltransferase
MMMALVEAVVGAPAFLYSCIGVVVLAICYIFYPAYKCKEGGLGCTETVLAGDKSSGSDDLLSLIIPAYNEEERLPIMLNETLDYLVKNRESLTQLFDAVIDNMQRRNKSVIKYEIIVVDDGSSDNTCDVVRKYAATLTSGDTVKLITMHQNVGKGGAVKTGMLRSLGQLCLMIDADGATDISDGLPKLLKEMYILNKNRNNRSLPPTLAVFGSRAHLENESTATRSKVRTFLMHAFHFFVKALCSSRIKDTQCGFKLFTRSAAVSLFTNLHLRRWAFDTELVIIAEKLNISVSEVGVIWHEVDGSKLDGGKLSLALVSLGMLRDMLCVRACYFLRIWALKMYQ